MSDRRNQRAKRKRTGQQRHRPATSMYEPGATNLEAACAHTIVLEGPPIVGRLYRIGLLQGHAGVRVQFIGEYAGVGEDPEVRGEIAYRFIVRNPSPPANAKNGTEEDPAVIWPLDIWHISEAQPGDMEMTIPVRFEGADVGETAFSRLGLPRVSGGGA